jgi:hypothetical protein
MDKYNTALIVALSISIIFSGGLIWYLRNVLRRLLFISDNLLDLTVMVGAYRGHLKTIYSMDMFFGDETFKHLIAHTDSLIKILEEYENIIDIAEPLEASELPQEEQEIDDEEKETSESPQDVFYAGSRGRNS